MLYEVITNPVNDTPTAADDSYSIDQDTTLNVSAPGVLTNDSVKDGLKTLSVTSDVSHGSLTLYADGSFDYTPTAGYTGSDSFTYSYNFV